MDGKNHKRVIKRNCIWAGKLEKCHTKMSFMMLRNHLCFLCGREKNKIRRSTKITVTSPKALWRRETVSLNFLLPFALFPLLVAVWSRLRARFSSLVSKFYAVLWLGRWCYRPWHRLRQIWPPKGFIPFFVYCRCDVLCYGFCGRVLDRRHLPSGRRFFFRLAVLSPCSCWRLNW